MLCHEYWHMTATLFYVGSCNSNTAYAQMMRNYNGAEIFYKCADLNTFQSTRQYGLESVRQYQ